jgi:hypothetical protein
MGTQVLASGTSGNSKGDSVGAVAEDTVPPGPTPKPDDGPPLECTSDPVVVNRTGVVESGGFVYRYIDLSAFRYDPATGESWIEMYEVCRRAGKVISARTYWQPLTTADPAVLAELAVSEVWKQVPLPTPSLSPVGPGYVNLGMWLAVAPRDPVSVTARAGTAWATTTAVVGSTTFDMGNGDVVTCDGVGDPISPSAKGSAAPSPVCGYTYRDVAPDGSYTITISTTWTVSWVGSGGTGGVLEPVVRSATVDYDVREIQTVGSG